MRQYFGSVDASLENIEALDSSFVAPALFDELIGPETPDGIQTVVGLKGSGKTALGRVAAQRFQGVTWMRNEKSTDFRFEVAAGLPRSGLLKNSLRLFLIEQLIEHLVRQQMIERPAFDKAVRGLKSIGGKVMRATTINAGFVQFDPKALFDVDKQNNLDGSWSAIKNLIKTTFNSQRCFMVLDDIDDYFVGLENSPRFIEGLCRAVLDINEQLRPHVYCLLLMKQGIWRKLFANPEEYDRIKFSIEFLRWNRDSCAAVLAGRIAALRGEKLHKEASFVNALPLLRSEFEGNDGQITKCFQTIYEYSVNGPRDVIDLCNSIRRKTPHRKIKIEDVRERLPQYSEEKLNGLNADFGHIYPEVVRFLQKIFQGATRKMRGEELAQTIENAMLEVARAKEEFADRSWYRDTSPRAMVKTLFDIGVVGVQKSGGLIFSNEDDSFSQNQLLSSELQIHSAFRPALGIGQGEGKAAEIV
jgi:hypothetical protein